MVEVFDTSLTTIAINSLSKAKLFLESEDDEYRWMWAAVAIDHSLYTFCITCLYENCPSFALGNSGKQTIGFGEALRRVQKDEYMCCKKWTFPTRALKLTKQQELHIKKLHREWRNYFMHFMDDQLEKIIDRGYLAADIVPLIYDALKAIEFLVIKSNIVPFYRYEGDRKKETKSLLNGIFSLVRGSN
jgi:hypothetical protein